jgi:nicotinate-nucleotide pyrophosphorylase (carboxylating)
MIELPAAAIIREAAARALGEDRGPADITTLACVKLEVQASARIFAKEPCVLSGLPVAEQVFREQDPALVLAANAADGDAIAANQTVLELSGPAASSRPKARILDTRKTIPGLRALQKYAVRCGGGANHRFGLYDRFLIKDNHLALMGEGNRLAEAIRAARALDSEALLEVEVDRLDQIPEILAHGVDIILLDNMSLDETRACVALIAGRAKTEASGNMTLSRVAEVAATGVDFISVGSLTHTVRSIDFSLEIDAPQA